MVLTDTILKGDNPRIISPLLKIEISSNGQKLLYFKPESAQI
jgi:hypothetical protein